VNDVNDDRRFALLAIEEARKSVAEDQRPHPKVGAIVVKGGIILAKAHRGESPKSHAEYVALEEKLPNEALAGSAVYTTLELHQKESSKNLLCPAACGSESRSRFHRDDRSEPVAASGSSACGSDCNW
jgi:pyrimidine deaminase RibD-like protein